MLHQLQRGSFSYFLEYGNAANGLIADASNRPAICSIAAVGMALAAYPVGVERGWWQREAALQRALCTLRFFWNSEQSEARDATGYRGFYYHFLNLQTGRRAWKSELSSIDSTLLLAGILTVGSYFDGPGAAERELRQLATSLYERVDWNWMRNGQATVAHGWRPEKGFLRAHWQGYNEALILYALGLGSPTHPLPDESYAAWCATYRWKKIYGHELLYAGPLFIHQFSHLWIDFRAIQDDYMKSQGIDYFENSRRATYVHQEYGRRNSRGFAGYGEHSWGITACEGPGPRTSQVAGRQVHFYDYQARGVPFGPDDGTLALCAVLGSLPFAPEIVLPTVQRMCEVAQELHEPEIRAATINLIYRDPANKTQGWICPHQYGINEGPVVLAIENYRSGLLWQIMRRCPYLIQGLRRAGFRGGWLDGAS